jgi:ribosomal protein S27AE
MDAYDVIGYVDSSGQEFCLRCAPGVYRQEAYELHRFEAEGECEQCGTWLATLAERLGATR